MKKENKILVGIPYHKAKNYAIKHCLERAGEFDYKNIEVVMRFDLGEYGGTDNVKKQREFMRNLVINGDYDYLYFMGVDTIPPKDTLDRLLKTAVKNDIKLIGGVYWGRHNAHNGTPEGAVAWIHALDAKEQNHLFNTMNTLVKVDGMGMDAVLIHREVLKKISFLSWEQNDDDYPFYDKAKALGYDTYIDTNIQCRHYFDPCGYTYKGQVFTK